MEQKIKAVGVIIPAHNEVKEITRCLTAVLEAIENARNLYPHLYFSVHCVADTCNDGTEHKVEKEFSSTVGIHVDCVSFRNPALSRQYGIQRFLEESISLSHQKYTASEAWVAMTDADTAVPPHWLSEQISLANGGMDSVVGTVEPRKSEIGDALYDLWAQRHDFSEGHSHVFGANLGVRASAYLHIGGFLPVEHSEDVTLVRALEEADFALCKTDRIRAVTSGRLQGKVSHGFSTYLYNLYRDARFGKTSA